MNEMGLPIVSCSCPILKEIEVQKEDYPSGVDLCTVYRLNDDKFCCGQQDLYAPSFSYFVFNDILIIVACCAGVIYGFYHLHSRYQFFKKFFAKKNGNNGQMMQQLNDEQFESEENEDKNTIVLDDIEN